MLVGTSLEAFLADRVGDLVKWEDNEHLYKVEGEHLMVTVKDEILLVEVQVEHWEVVVEEQVEH